VHPRHHDSPDVLQAVYHCPPGELTSHRLRYQRLCALFESMFPGIRPETIVRAPGRVNLIGEHTDYNGYPVLPMAIDRDFVFAIAARPGRKIEICNEDPLFEKRAFDASYPIVPFSQGDWGNYVKAAVHGILEAGLVDREKAVGFNAVVGGTIPESAGLSSSSALVVGSALAFLAANKTSVDYRLLADLLARAERYVGSEGGGMDQAVSLLAEAGNAVKIDFFPLQTTPTPLPENLNFVVCNSLIRAPKSESVRYAYNRRVIECRLASALLSKAVAQKTGRRIAAARLADASSGRLGIEGATMDEIAREGIGIAPLSLKEVAQRLGTETETVEQKYCRLRDGSVLKEPTDGFQVWKRYRHVITEAARVDQAVRALAEGAIHEVGKLMNQSHASCRDDYEISCPELEALVSIARDHGALGARLTGAGFGGCTVNAVPSGMMDEFVSGVTRDYYHGYVKRENGKNFTPYRELRDVLFPCRASMGAGTWQTAELMR